MPVCYMAEDLVVVFPNSCTCISETLQSGEFWVPVNQSFIYFFSWQVSSFWGFRIASLKWRVVLPQDWGSYGINAGSFITFQYPANSVAVGLSISRCMICFEYNFWVAVTPCWLCAVVLVLTPIGKCSRKKRRAALCSRRRSSLLGCGDRRVSRKDVQRIGPFVSVAQLIAIERALRVIN